MSFIHRDWISPRYSKYSYNTKMFQRFDKAWSKKNIDGISVYDGKLVYYHDGVYIEDDKLKNFMKAIGTSWETISKEQQDGDVEQMFFKLKKHYEWDGSTRPTKGNTPPVSFESTGMLTPPTLDDFKEAHKDYKIGDEITIKLSYGGSLGKYINEHSLEWYDNGGSIVSKPLNSSTIRSVILSNVWYYVANSRHKPYNENTFNFSDYNGSGDDIKVISKKPKNVASPAVACGLSVDDSNEYIRVGNRSVGLFALFDKEHLVWKPKLINGANVHNELIGSKTMIDGEAVEYQWEMKFEYIGVDNSSSLYGEIYSWYQAYSDYYSDPFLRHNKSLNVSMVTDTEIKKALYNIMEWKEGGGSNEITNSLFYKGHLRAKEASLMKREDFADFLGASIDTDYNLKDKGIVADIITGVIIVLAIVAGVLSGGTTLPLIAQGLAVAAGVATVGLYIAGNYNLVESHDMKLIGDFAQITGVASSVLGVGHMLNGLREAATNELKQEALRKAGEEATKEAMEKAVVSSLDVAMKMVSLAVDSAITSISSMFTSFSVDSAARGLSYINKISSYIVNKENQKAEAEVEVIDEEINRLEEEATKIAEDKIIFNAGLTIKQTLDYGGELDMLTDLNKRFREQSPEGHFSRLNASFNL